MAATIRLQASRFWPLTAAVSVPRTGASQSLGTAFGDASGQE